MIKIIIISLIFLYSSLHAKPIVNIDFTAFGKNDFQFTLNPKRRCSSFISANLMLDLNTSLKEFEIDNIEIYNPKIDKILHYRPHYCCNKLFIIIKIPYTDELITYIEPDYSKRWYTKSYSPIIKDLSKLHKTKWYKSALPFFSPNSKITIYYKNGKVITYDIKFIKSFEKAIKEFESEYKSSIRWNIFWVILAYIILIIIFYKILKAVISKIYKKTKQSMTDIQNKRQEIKIKKIEEDEIIRANIKKSIHDKQNNEIEDLQEIINSALAKGDTETAQSLLKILNNKKIK